MAGSLRENPGSMGLLPGLRYHILFVIHLAVTKDRQDVGKDEEDSCEAAAKEPFSFPWMMKD